MASPVAFHLYGFDGFEPPLWQVNDLGFGPGLAMSLEAPEQIRTLQRKLYLKAKTEPEFRCRSAEHQDTAPRAVAAARHRHCPANASPNV
jgi:hypothetical protein